MTAATSDVCGRCKGKGFGDWVVEHGICYACRGTGSKAVAKRRRAEAKATIERIMRLKRASFTFQFETEQTGTLRRFEAEKYLHLDCLGQETFYPGRTEEMAPGFWVTELVSFDPAWAGFDADGVAVPVQ